MWQYQNTDELYHHGVLGMKWGHRKSVVQIRKERANEHYKDIQKRKPNSKQALKAKIINKEIQSSKYGKTNKQIATSNAIKRAGSLGIQTAAAVGLIASGAVVTAPVLSIIGAVGISAGSTIYRSINKKNTNKKLIDNHSNKK